LFRSLTPITEALPKVSILTVPNIPNKASTDPSLLILPTKGLIGIDALLGACEPPINIFPSLCKAPTTPIFRCDHVFTTFPPLPNNVSKVKSAFNRIIDTLKLLAELK